MLVFVDSWLPIPCSNLLKSLHLILNGKLLACNALQDPFMERDLRLGRSSKSDDLKQRKGGLIQDATLVLSVAQVAIPLSNG